MAHGTARRPKRVGVPHAALLAFLPITTNPSIFDPPLAVDEACDQVSEWISLPNVWIPSTTADHVRILIELIRTVGSAGNLVQDAHLAALAIEHDLTLYSTDLDFARFPGLRWVNPFALDER